MFLEKNSEEEFFSEVNEKLSQAHNKENYYVEKINHVVDLLISGAYHLNQAGLEKEAKVIIMMTKDISDDPAVRVSPKEMVKNLETEGWVFPPAKDLGLIDDEPEEDAAITVSEETDPSLHDF